MRTLLTWTIVLIGLATLTALLIVGGCSTAGRMASTASPGYGYPNAQAVPPTFNLSDYFDSNGRLKSGVKYQPHALRSAAPSGSLPALDEEVWVIVKHEEPASVGPVGSPRRAPDGLDLMFDTSGADGDDDMPTCGTLLCRMPPIEGNDRSPRLIPLPLQHTAVSATVNAYIASVEVTQQFANPYSSKIEAVYVFPLPENAAVNGFVMTIGERRIRGIIREREEAQQIYNAAKAQGYVASLLTQERPNIFTQRVANIEPGKRVDVNITYFNTLAYDDGWYEFVFPMVVGPRFNPPTTSNGIGAVARNAYGTSGQSTEIQYLAPGERSGHDISLAVDLRPGTSVEEVVCRSHKVHIDNDLSEQVRVTLDPADCVPNKDFVLRYRIAGDTVKTALLVNLDAGAGGGGGYFTFMLIPPLKPSRDAMQRRPLEMIFVVDCSGSMNGQPLAQAKAAVDHALGELQASDTFQIVQFSEQASQLGRQPLPATPANIKRGRAYVRGLDSEGGTMMINGIKAALDFPHDAERLRIVTFLTDGFIGDESEILGAIHDRLGETRIFSFGVGSSCNRYLMDAMARMGGGAVAYLSLQDRGDQVMDAYLARIASPVLSDIEIDWGQMNVSDVMPPENRMPDLYAGRPLIVTGRFQGQPPSVVRISANAGEQRVQAEFPVDPEASKSGAALASVWARMHIAALMDRATWDQRDAHELPQQIRTLALRYGLMSAYTSFIAVDSLTQTAGTQGTTVSVAVPVPEGVKYETTVREP